MTAGLAGRAGAITVIAASTLALAACGGIGANLTYDDTVPTKITAVVLDGGSGDVLVRTSASAQTQIKRIYRVNSDPHESYRLDGTVLHIANDCGSNCRVSYQIDAPAGVGVSGKLTSGDVNLTDVGVTDLTLTSGDVRVHGATGKVSVTATSGDVTVEDAKAGVTLEATSGDLHAIDISGGPVIARVTSGDATVKLSTPASVTASADSGDLMVMVPAGAYQQHIVKGSGDQTVAPEITSDPASKNIIDARVGSGDLTVATA